MVEAAEEGVAFGTLMNEFVDANERTGRARALQARFGLVRLAMKWFPDAVGLTDLPEAPHGPLIETMAKPDYWRTASEEGAAYLLTPPVMRAPGGFGTLGSIALVVIRYGKPFDIDDPDLVARMVKPVLDETRE